MGSIPGLARSPGGENGNPLQYSCLENPMHRALNLTGYSPWGHKESDTTEWLSPQKQNMREEIISLALHCKPCSCVFLGEALQAFGLKGALCAMTPRPPSSLTLQSPSQQTLSALNFGERHAFFTHQLYCREHTGRTWHASNHHLFCLFFFRVWKKNAYN